MIFSFALLTADQLRAVQALERELGTTIVAFQSQEATMSRLSTEALSRLQEEERRTGLTLVAVTPAD